MLSLAHTATGAFIGSKFTNPLISTPLVLGSHYLEDYIIHWDCGTGLSKGVKKKTDAILQELFELGLSFIFIYIFFQAGHEGVNYGAWFGAFVSLIPDFLEAPRNFLNWEPSFLRPFNEFHGKFHNSTPNMIVGLTPQLVLLFVIALAASY